MTDTTVILNYYNKTVEMLNRQLTNLQKQSLPPKYIWGCFLGCKDDSLIEAFLKWKSVFPNLSYIKSDYNFKYIGRYQLAITAPTEYVIILDDDRFPRKDFIKRTVEILSTKNCIIGQYGWILNEKKLDINGLFAFPAHMININEKKLYFNYNEIDFYSKNTNCEFNLTIDSSNVLIQKYVHHDKDDRSLVHVDYLCGGSCFRKSTLCKLFNNPIPTIETGEDIIFCLTAKNQGIPVYCFAPETDEVLFAYDNNTTSTSGIDIFKKRSELIKNYWVNK
jgi:GT2 family glycosyltransferase